MKIGIQQQIDFYYYIFLHFCYQDAISALTLFLLKQLGIITIRREIKRNVVFSIHLGLIASTLLATRYIV